MSKAQGIAQSANQGQFKNRIINGDCRIDQRNNGASVTITANPQYTLDRWFAGVTNASKISVQQNAGSVTPPVGFTKYLGVTSLAATTPAAGDVYYMQQSIEGFNIADLAWGTANAKTITISFQVYSSLTGTFGAVILNASSNRSYPFNYTISSANTWTSISVTIAGDTTGTWATDNTTGIQLRFGLGAGSTYQGTAGAWGTANVVTTTGATSVVGTNGATFYITGVQLEKGSTATNYDVRSYGTELSLCCRYYQKSYNDGVAVGAVTTEGGITNQAQSNVTFVPMIWNFAVKMRATPTMTAYSTQTGTAGKFYSNAPAGDNNVSAGFVGASNATFTTGGTSITATGYVIAQMTASAEL